MTPDLDTLERLARGAIPGPWKVDRELSIIAPKAPVMTEGAVRIVIEEIPLHMDDETRDFIAAANPQTILSLIAALREAEGALVRCGHNPLRPKGVFPTAQEIYDDRAERVAAAQEALTRIRALKGELEKANVGLAEERDTYRNALQKAFDELGKIAFTQDSHLGRIYRDIKETLKVR